VLIGHEQYKPPQTGYNNVDSVSYAWFKFAYFWNWGVDAKVNYLKSIRRSF
jgi:hypothetical protein